MCETITCEGPDLKTDQAVSSGASHAPVFLSSPFACSVLFRAGRAVTHMQSRLSAIGTTVTFFFMREPRFFVLSENSQHLPPPPPRFQSMVNLSFLSFYYHCFKSTFLSLMAVQRAQCLFSTLSVCFFSSRQKNVLLSSR